MINSCSEPDTSGVLSFGDTLSINYHQTLVSDDNSITLRFNDMTEDSRCPEGLLCFWVGNAAPEFTFSITGQSADFILNTFDDYSRDTTLLDYQIKLLSVHPYPQENMTIDSNDYFAKLIVVSN